MEPTNTTAPEPGLLEEKCRRLEHQMSTLKNVSQLRKSLLELRERQVKDLISKLKFYEIIVGEERESRHSLSVRLESAEVQCGQLTDKLANNLQTIDEMKTNYETKISTLINELQTSEQRNQQLSDQLNCAQLRISEVTRDLTMEEMNRKLEEKDKFAKELQHQLKRIWERNKAMSYQMSLLNNLFTETEGVTIDFEKIKAIGDIVRESQALSGESEDEVLEDDEQGPVLCRRHSFDLENLLDRFEKSENVMPAEIPGEESCYKSVDTKRGPQLVLSVSRTFIKLKDLIVEKKSLQKEIDTLKTLNTKLESKVDKQEHRLYRVTMELNKTWSLVSKLKQQHKRLYNSEAVLRYELQEKRALLDKLKNELSASREKWRRVRQKNSQSQIEWEKLRDEFAQRKHQSSQESGTFSEIMSVSSGENDVTALEEVDDEVTVVRSRRSSKTKGISSAAAAVACGRRSAQEFDTSENDEEGPEEDEFEDGARALSPLEDETYVDPLEELVSNLVADIDNEADTEEDSTSRTAPPENDSSPSPDFEDRMRRRADRLRMLEEQCHVLHTKLQASTARSEALSTKLAELHDHYGPAGSTSTESPSDDQHHHPQKNEGDGDVSQNQEEEVNASHPQTHSRMNDDQVSTTSTDAAYVSGTENNSIRGDESCSGAKNPPDTPTTTENNATSFSCFPNDCTTTSTTEEQDNSNRVASTELIESSENSNITAPSESNPDSNSIHPTTSTLENASQEETQGHSENERRNDSTLLAVAIPNLILSSPPPSREANAESDTSAEADPKNPTPTTSTLETQHEETQKESECAPDSSSQNHLQLPVNDCTDSTDTNAANLSSTVNEEQVGPAPLSPETINPAISHETPPPPPPSTVEEPLPIQETVVQHFPSPSEEETNEFAPLQIRPEFLRILQEADEATNSSLDWMPSLLTITHSVALLRLDPELPANGRNNGEGLNDNGNSNRNGVRPISESLRIEIPQESPPPAPRPTTTSRRHHHHHHDGHQGNAGARTGHEQNEGNGRSSETDERDEEQLPAYAKDPSFLSRMIIKQLPKRLQLLKNENHTLQMETAEAKMRMKEMKRQLVKETDKQQQLALSLDAQIEEKNLIEFELREEIEKKEKVIEELQTEIDTSKDYVDELKREKDEVDANLQIMLQEKLDMEQPKVPADSVKNCNNCKRAFSVFSRRRHHCAICGKVFCKDCAILREPNKRFSKRPRLCTRCHFRRQRLLSLVKQSEDAAKE